jgi:hypothetical protein
MAIRNSTDVGFFLVGGRNLLSTLTAFGDKISAVIEETTVLGASAPTHAFVGIVRSTFSMDGFYDDATGGQNEALVGKEGTSQVVCYAPSGNTLAYPLTGMSGAFLNAHERIVQLEKFHRAKATAEVSGNREDGVILQALATKTTAGNTEATSVDHTTDPTTQTIAITSNSIAAASVVTTPVPHGLATNDVVLIAGVATSNPTINGERTVTYISPTTFSVPVNVSTGGTGGTFTRASSPNGGAGYLQVGALTLGGYTNLVVKIRHSTNNSSFTDLITFTAVTSAYTGQRVAVAGAVNRYLATSHACTGSGSGMSADVMVGFCRG